MDAGTLVPWLLGTTSEGSMCCLAVREYDDLGRQEFLRKYGFGPAQNYALIVDGRSYDSKAILGAAYGYATGRHRSSSDFSGGVGSSGAATVLQTLGFELQFTTSPRSNAPVRSSPRSSFRARSPQPDHPILTETADVILVGCVKTKREIAAPARDLYTSPLFRKRRAFAEASGKPWFILSALHGLVHPDEVLEPYDMYLAGQSRDYRRQWGERVVASLMSALDRSVTGVTVEVHAGSAYAEPLQHLLTSGGATTLTPLRGLTQGEHLAWYDDHRLAADSGALLHRSHGVAGGHRTEV